VCVRVRAHVYVQLCVHVYMCVVTVWLVIACYLDFNPKSK